jgi:hypothetical protein
MLQKSGYLDALPARADMTLRRRFDILSKKKNPPDAVLDAGRSDEG